MKSASKGYMRYHITSELHVSKLVLASVEKNAYQRTKKTLLPDVPLSDEEYLATSGKRFFLLGMPDGFDRNAIRKVVKEINWTVGVIVPHGWKTWSIFADGEPPVRDIKFQGAHIVIADGCPGSRLGLCVCVVFVVCFVGLVVGFFLWGNLFSITGSLQLLTDQVSH